MLQSSMKKRYAVTLCCNCGEPRVVKMLRSFFLCPRCGRRNNMSRVEVVSATDDIDEVIHTAKRIRLTRHSRENVRVM